MSHTAISPYADGSDLDSLWGWAQRLGALLADDRPPTSCDWMIFRPDRTAANAMMRLSVSYPHVVRQIADTLDFVEKWFERLPEGDAAAVTLARAMDSLHGRIKTGITTIEHAQSEASPGIDGYVPADTLWHEAGIRPNRLSEARTNGRVRAINIASGRLDSQGKKVSVLYHRADALKYLQPKQSGKKRRNSR